LNTYGIGEWMAHKYSKEFVGNENKKKKTGSKAAAQTARRFLCELPKLESHYCRKDTKKMYLEKIWTSKKSLYREYENYMKAANNEKLTASICTFVNIFSELNLGLFLQKKDECDTCCSYRSGNLDQNQYDLHIKMKDRAHKKKRRRIKGILVQALWCLRWICRLFYYRHA